MEKCRLKIICFFVVLQFGFAAVLLANDDEEKKADLSASFEKLLEQLGSRDFKQRNKAQMEIWSLGESVIPYLENFKDKESPEVRSRLNNIYDLLRVGAAPDTDPKVLELILEIRNSSSAKEVLNKSNALIALDVRKPLILLYDIAEEGEVKDRLLLQCKKIIRPLATKLFWEKNYEEAESLLLKLKQTSAASAALASLYRYQGRLEEVEKKLLADDKSDSTSLLLYVLAGQEKWKEALDLAHNKDLKSIAAKFALLTGDPDPLNRLIEEYLTYSTNAGPEVIEVKSLSYKLIRAREEDETEEVKLLSEKLKGVFADTTSLDKIALRNTGLLLTGQMESFEKDVFSLYFGLSSRQFNQLIGSYVENCEAPEALLKAIGAPLDKSAHEAWALERVSKVIQGVNDKAMNGATRSEWKKLSSFITFLDSRSEKEILRRILDPLFDHFQKMLEKEDLRGGSEAYVNEVLFTFIGWYMDEKFEDCSAASIDYLYTAIFGRAEDDLVWELLGGEKEKMDSDDLRVLFILKGLMKAAKRSEVVELNNSLMEKVLAMPENERAIYWEKLYSYANSRGDVRHGIELLEKLSSGERDDHYTLALLTLYQGVGEWEKVESMISEFAKENQISQKEYLNWAVALKKLGRESEAKEKLALFDLYCLGDPSLIKMAAIELSSHGMIKESLKRYEQVLALYDVRSSRYMDTVLLLNIVEPHYLTLGKWKMAHSIASAHRYLELYRLDHNQNQSFDPAQSLLISNQADMTKGLVMYKVDPKKAKVLLLEAVKTSRGGGRLADFFFPSLEKIGAKDTHKKAFGIVKKQLAEILKVYPKGGNTLNVYAWTAAKARYDLDKAEEYSLRSLESIPRSPAYTDTLAEINFAKGNRKKAIEVSTEAVTEALSYSRSDISSSLRMYKSLDIQLKHFENDPLPRKR